jgi:hypothetical protein
MNKSFSILRSSKYWMRWFRIRSRWNSMKLGNAHKALFYEKYNAMLSSKIGKTKELDEEKYNYIVQVKLNYRRMMG